VLLVVALWGVDWQEMIATLRHGQARYTLPAFIVLSISFLMRGLRWWVMLQSEQPVSPRTTFWGTAVGYLGNTLLPARAGEIIRSVMVAMRTGINTSYVFATALTERLMDAVFLVLLSLGALLFMPALPPWLLVAVQIFTALGLIGLAVLFLAPRLAMVGTTLINTLPLAAGIRQRLSDVFAQFCLGLQALLHPGRALMFVVLTIVIWLLDAMFAILIALMLGYTMTVPEALLLLAGLGLGSAAPSTPGYVGIYQFVAVSILPLFGWSQAAAVAYILTYQFVTLAVVLVWGFLGMGQLGLSPRMLALPGTQPAARPPEEESAPS
jgi:hypothetical protein